MTEIRHHNFIYHSAINEIHGSDRKDYSRTFKLKKLNGEQAIQNQAIVSGEVIPLPNTEDRYYLYITQKTDEEETCLKGPNEPYITPRWRLLKDVVNDDQIFIAVSTHKGVMLSLFSTYYTYNRRGGLIIAVKEDQKNIDFKLDDVYLRLYRSSFIHSYLSDNEYFGKPYVATNHFTITDLSDVESINNEINGHRQNIGFAWITINGKRINGLSTTLVSIGDQVEYIYDKTIISINRIPIYQLYRFKSTIDNSNRYLLYNDFRSYPYSHYPENFTKIYIEVPLTNMLTHNEIEYDVIFQRDEYSDYGCYLFNGMSDAIRPIIINTHSIRSNDIDYLRSLLLTEYGVEYPTQNHLLEVKIRKTINNIPTIYNSSYHHELLKFTVEEQQDILKTLTFTQDGVDHANPFHIAAIENSIYNKLIYTNVRSITKQMVEDAYGYNAISTKVGKSIHGVVSDGGIKTVSVPLAYQYLSTVYEYDESGLFINTYTHYSSDTYYVKNTACELVEFLSGVLSMTPNITYGTHNLNIPENYNYKVLKCQVISSAPTYEWEEAVENVDYIINSNHTLSIYNESLSILLMVRDDGVIVGETIDNLIDDKGTFKITLREYSDRGDGNQLYTMAYPPSHIEVIMDNHTLIRDIDYIVDFPTIYIFNYKYLSKDLRPTLDYPTVHYRAYGFSDVITQLPSVEQSGIVEFGIIGHYEVKTKEVKTYHPRDDRNIKLIIDGKVVRKELYDYFEDHWLAEDQDHPLNGLPYCSQEIPLISKHFTTRNIHNLKNQSISKDLEISKIMTYLKGVSDTPDFPTSTNPIIELVSPFIQALVYDLGFGVLDPDPYAVDYDMQSYLTPYLHYLEHDPINLTYGLEDTTYFRIRAHCYNEIEYLPYTRYLFLYQVILAYANNLIDLPLYVSTDEGDPYVASPIFMDPNTPTGVIGIGISPNTVYVFNTTNPTFKLQPFITYPLNIATHLSTTYEISSTSNFTAGTIVESNIQSTVNLTEWVAPIDNLEVNTIYYCRAKFYTATLESNYSITNMMFKYNPLPSNLSSFPTYVFYDNDQLTTTMADVYIYFYPDGTWTISSQFTTPYEGIWFNEGGGSYNDYQIKFELISNSSGSFKTTITNTAVNFTNLTTPQLLSFRTSYVEDTPNIYSAMWRINIRRSSQPDIVNSKDFSVEGTVFYYNSGGTN